MQHKGPQLRLMAFYGLLRDCRRNCTETDNELSLGHYDRPTRERSVENTNCCKPVEVHLAGAAAVHLGSIIAYLIRVNCPMYLSSINYEAPCTQRRREMINTICTCCRSRWHEEDPLHSCSTSRCPAHVGTRI